MKKLMAAILFFCLVSVPLSALAGPLYPASFGHHRDNRIFITANNGGEVNPDGMITVRDGKSVAIRIKPHDGYVVKKVLVDGRDVGRVKLYKFYNVRDSHRVQVVFERVHRFGWPHNDGHRDRH